MDKVLLDNINKAIKQRTNYGYRRELTTSSGWIINWSNGNANWWVGDKVKKNTILTLDANQIFIPKNKKEILEIIDELEPLPLYKNSFEKRSTH